MIIILYGSEKCCACSEAKYEVIFEVSPKGLSYKVNNIKNKWL